MKKISLVILCLWMVSCLSACDDVGPVCETEDSESSQSESSQSENSQLESVELEKSELLFYASDVFFYEVTQDTYEKRLKQGHIVGICSTEQEWLEWSRKNLSQDDDSSGFHNYNADLFEHNVLLVYQCSMDNDGKAAVGIESILYEDNVLEVIEDTEVLLMKEISEDKYYIPYQVCWLKEGELSKQIYEKYKMKHFYSVDDRNAYYVYMNLLLEQVEVEYTHNGGKTWENYTYVADEIWGNGDVYASFIDEYTAYILHMPDVGLGNMPKILYYMGDEDIYIREVGYLTTDIDNYPVGMDFCSKDVGYIITNYRNTQDFIYRTEDGGQTWMVQTVPAPEYAFSYLQGVSIECTSESEAILVVEVVTAEGSHQIEYMTDDGGKTWYQPLYEYDDDNLEN